MCFSSPGSGEPDVCTSISVLARISNDDFTMRRATSLDAVNYRLTCEMIIDHFQVLQAMGLNEIDPRLVVNIDETGFGQSKSGRSRLQKVIVPKSFVGSPAYREEEEKRYVSCIAATTLSGTILKPALISNREEEAADAYRCPFLRIVLLTTQLRPLFHAISSCTT